MIKYGTMVSWDEENRMWQISGTPPREVLCPVCSMPMLRYENPERWLCFNIEVHDMAMRNEEI
jgi:hypothetical protein